MLKKCKLVMLTTNKKAEAGNIYIKDNILSKVELGIGNVVSQHLYIISDEEIKENDWIITSESSINEWKPKVWQFKDSNYYTVDGLLCDYDNNSTFKKIIATTDKSLGNIIGDKLIDVDTNTRELIGKLLPQPSQSFIGKYIIEYNKGNKIEEVMVEYNVEYEPGSKVSDREYDIYTLKISSDNTITIKKIKNSWSEEEVRSLLNLALATGAAYGNKMNQTNATDWIEKNL